MGPGGSGGAPTGGLRGPQGLRGPPVGLALSVEAGDAVRLACVVASAAACPRTCRSAHIERPAQNWNGQGESDCLVKTKQCEGASAC